ncbi:hypothetical protein CR513_61366, partial [Mucuna pruriens]
MKEDCRLYVRNFHKCQATTSLITPLPRNYSTSRHHGLSRCGAWTSLDRFPWLKDKYGIPNSMVTNNEIQFISNTLGKFYENLQITHKVTLAEHPQMNS